MRTRHALTVTVTQQDRPDGHLLLDYAGTCDCDHWASAGTAAYPATTIAAKIADQWGQHLIQLGLARAA